MNPTGSSNPAEDNPASLEDAGASIVGETIAEHKAALALGCNLDGHVAEARDELRLGEGRDQKQKSKNGERLLYQRAANVANG